MKDYALINNLVIYAPNVGGGGGLVLLRKLLSASWPVEHVVGILDRRGQAQISEHAVDVEIHWVDSTLRGRWHAEKLLRRLAGADSLILCFHNLPPVLPVQGLVICYIQNAYVVGIIHPGQLRGWLRIRSAMENVIARWFRRRIHRYVVQTVTMAAALRDWYGPGAPPIDILPFTAFGDSEDPPSAAAVGEALRWDFLYVSDGSFHKNHLRLFEAWRLLAERGIMPSLAVTLHPERDTVLREQVRMLRADGLRIEDLGLLPHADVLAAYHQAGATIFPSCAESFGIPLIEARTAGLPILAPELDYVRDVCDPVQTFDAQSPRSIARAVLRFLGHPADRVPLLTPDGFAASLCAMEAPSKT